MGLLTNNGPQPWHPAAPELKVGEILPTHHAAHHHDPVQALCAEAGAYCAERGVELGKLSVHQNIQSQRQPIAITLLGVGKMDILRINMEIITEGLTSKEQEVLKEVQEKFFNKLDKNAASWENVEVTQYNKAIGKNKI